MPKTWVKWNQDDKDFVKNNYDKMTVKEIASILGRTEKSVRSVIERHGLSLDSLERNKHFNWTAESTEFLQDNYKTMSEKAIADALGTNERSVRNKKKKLGLHKNQHLPFSSDGYAQQYINGKKVTLHRYVMEQKLGRALEKGERVHHINGDKMDYAESNLYLCTGKQEHMLIHGNLEKVSYELIKRGVILFDKEEGKYYINEDAIKEDNDEIHRLV